MISGELYTAEESMKETLASEASENISNILALDRQNKISEEIRRILR